MSALARHGDQAARLRKPPAERVRAAGRLRRANAGTLTEITRSLLHDARDVGTAGRLRRANAGTLTEITRSLLHDAREVGVADARRREQEDHR